MTKNSHTEYDEISYLLKKIEWPEPSRDLEYRIQNSVSVNVIPFMSDMSVVQIKSPMMTFMAVVLALFLGVASGTMTGNAASATEYTHPYGSSGVSLTGIYMGQSTTQTQ